MPKARRYKKGPVKRSTQSAPPLPAQKSSAKPGITSGNRSILSPGVRGPQSLILPGMVVLGCWGMAFSFFVLSTEPNHNLFGGLAVLMALLWTFSFGIRLRKLLLLRQRS
jgi:hypothetical protein